MNILTIILQSGQNYGYITDYVADVCNSSTAGTVLNTVISGAFGAFAAGGIMYVIFRRQYKLKFQAEAEKVQHEANQEGASADLHKAKTQQEIRHLFDEELTARLKQIAMLRHEKANEEEKRYKAESEALSYKKLCLKLENQIERFNRNMEKIEALFCPDCQKILNDVKN